MVDLGEEVIDLGEEVVDLAEEVVEAAEQPKKKKKKMVSLLHLFIVGSSN